MTRLIEDQFSGGSDGDDINARTPDTTNTPGGTWAHAQSNGIEMDGAGAAKWNTTGDNARIITNTADHRTTVEFSPGGADNTCRVFCRANNTGYGGGTFDAYVIDFLTATDQIQLKRRVNASDTNIGTAISFAIDNTLTYFIGVQVLAADLTVYAGTTFPPPAIHTASDANIDGTTVGGTYAGLVGLTRADAAGRFNTFYVDTADAPAASAGGIMLMSDHFNGGARYRAKPKVHPVRLPRLLLPAPILPNNLKKAA